MATNVAARAGGARAFTEHEHRELASGIDRLHAVACDIGHRPTPELSVNILGVLQWLDRVLEPHMAWEEAWLFPEVDRRAGTRWATKAARFDHQQVAEMGTRVRADQHRLARDGIGGSEAEIRCHLFGLESLVRSHIEREERFLIPLLDDEEVGRDAAETPDSR